MKKFMMVDIFNRGTGERIPNGHKAHVGFYCDYCGAEFTDEDPGANSVSFEINEESGSEESWYYHEFENEKGLYTFSFWRNQPQYHYCMDEDWDGSCSGAMLRKAVRLKEADSLHNAMQLARVGVVNKLLKSNVDPFMLGFEEN